MADHYRTLGIILKKKERGEADQLFTIYTKDFGKLNILGKGIRKISSKLKAGMEIFYLSEIEFIQGKAHKTLTDTILIDRFKNLRSELKRLNTAFKIVKVLDRFSLKQEPDKKIWQLLEESFKKLDDVKSKIPNPELIYYYFLWNLFSVLGYQPEMTYCLSCGKKISPGLIYFTPEGGLICQSCSKKKTLPLRREITQDTIKIIRIILRKDWGTFSRLKIRPFHQKELKEISQIFSSTILTLKL